MIKTNYRHLYYFYVIASSKTMTAASQKLLLNQSTLSTQLHQFEKSIGRPLFERRQQRLILTPGGRQVLDYARRIFEIGKEMEADLAGSAPRGRRTISAGIMAGTPRSFGHAMLRGFRNYDPDALIILREGAREALLADLREFRLDALLTDVGLRGSEREEFENHLIAQVPIVLAAAPQVARNYKKLPEDFDGAPFLIPSAPSPLHGQILDLLSEWRVTPRIIGEIQDVELVRRMVLAGEGIAPLNAFTVSMSLPKGGIVIVGKRRDWGLRESVYLVTRRAGQSKRMIEHMRREMANP